jgi:hypothetical protein
MFCKIYISESVDFFCESPVHKNVVEQQRCYDKFISLATMQIYVPVFESNYIPNTTRQILIRTHYTGDMFRSYFSHIQALRKRSNEL